MPRHRKPRDATPSRGLIRFAEEIVRNANAPILDVACGYGRNAAYLASLGGQVVCLDIDMAALEHVASLPEASRLIARHLDLLADPWPFADGSVGAIVNVHYFEPMLLDRFASALRRGGYLYLETIDGYGENYLDLPPQRFIRDRLRDQFHFTWYEERRVGPPHGDASSVRLFAVRL